jgi:hypothetical protein
VARLSIADIAQAEVEGMVHEHIWRKTPTQTTASGFWFDLSLSPGIPKPQYYTGTELTATQLTRSNNGSINHGSSVSPYQKVIRQFSVMTTSATPVGNGMVIKLEDNLLFYPLVDESLDGEAQTMDNTQTLPRYTDGVGVMIKAVVTNSHATGGTGVTFTCSYTNQSGTSGRTTSPVSLSTQFVAGTIISSGNAQANTSGPYLPLQDGDYGVRSIQSVTFTGSDVGLLALCLVKPLCDSQVLSVNSPFWTDYLVHSMNIPRVYDDACLNLSCLPQGSLAGATLIGTLKTVWF